MIYAQVKGIVELETIYLTNWKTDACIGKTFRYSKECIDRSVFTPRRLENIKIIPALHYTNLAINTVGVKRKLRKLEGVLQALHN